MKSKKPFRRFRRKAREAPYEEVDRSKFLVGLHVFADGACEPNPGPGGWGVAVYHDGVEIASDHGGDADTTNNRMELTGLHNGIEAAKALRAPVTVWCDSQYAVKGTNEWRHGWKKNGWQRGGANADPKNRLLLNAELWQAIDAALSGAEQVTIRWVKGHAGVVGNERADELSNLGIAAVTPVTLQSVTRNVTSRDSHGTNSEETGDYLTAQYRQIMGG